MPLSNNHLINVVHFISTLPPPYLDGLFTETGETAALGEISLTPEITTLIKDSNMMVGQQYYEAKVPKSLMHISSTDRC